MRTTLLNVISVIGLMLVAWLTAHALKPVVLSGPSRVGSSQNSALVYPSKPLPTPSPSATAYPMIFDDQPEGVSNGRTIDWVPCITVTFQPRRTITAYELSRLLPYIHGACMKESDWKALGRARRHLQRVNPAIRVIGQ